MSASADYVCAWLVAFVATQLIELPIYRRLLGVGWFDAFAASAITHPLIWFAIFPTLHTPYWLTVTLAELFALVAEWLWFLRGAGAKRAFVGALTANGASFCFGLAIRALLSR